MDKSQVSLAASLLRQREATKKRIDEIDPYATSGLLQLSTSRPVLPTDSARARLHGGIVEAGSEVAISGDALKIVTDLIGSLLSRQLEEIDRKLADLGVTETMAADNAAEAAPEPEQDPAGIEILVFGVRGNCDCPTCTGSRA